jgi:hypothetical protein
MPIHKNPSMRSETPVESTKSMSITQSAKKTLTAKRSSLVDMNGNISFTRNGSPSHGGLSQFDRIL